MSLKICKSKRKFYTENEAISFCLAFFKKHGIYNSPYHCYHCNQYHTTSRLIEPSETFIDKFNKWFGMDVL